MKKARFLIALMLIFALVVSCMQAVTVSAAANDEYVGFSISKPNNPEQYYHIVKEVFSFETRRSETFERKYKVYNPTDHDVWVEFEVIDSATWYPTTKSGGITVPSGKAIVISTGNIAVDGNGKITCVSSKDSNLTSEILLTEARLRINIGGFDERGNQKNLDPLSDGEKIYFESLDQAELSWYNNGTTSSSTLYAAVLEKELPALDFIGWSISGATQCYHMISGAFSFETDRAGTTFRRTYDIYNSSDGQLKVKVELDNNWKEYAIGAEATIPVGGHMAVSTGDIVVDAEGYILDYQGQNRAKLTDAKIRFNIGHNGPFDNFTDTDCYIISKDENETAWLQDNAPTGTLNATVKRIKMSDCDNAGIVIQKQKKVDFSDPNLMISGRYMENADGSRKITFEPYTELNFTGTSVSVNGSGSCYFEIDGLPHKENGMYKSVALSEKKVLAENLSEGNHCVRLYATSQRCNYTIKEFYIDHNAQTLPPSYNKTIEFIGSSSLVAYTDARDPHDGYDNNSNYMISFAYQTGKKLQADGFRFNTVAYGGSGVVFQASANGAATDGDKDYLTMQERYKLEHEYWGGKGSPEATPIGTWDHSKYVPDYVALYLGANDLGQGTDTFKTNYKGFIDQLLGYYPNAVIIAMAPYNTNDTYAAALESIVNEYNSKQVRFINTLDWGVRASDTDGIHAVAADHAILAQKLYNELQTAIFPQIKSVSLTVSDSLTLNYYTKNSGKLVITHNNKTTELSGIPDGANGYRYEYKGITPQCMNDAIKAEYKVDGKTVDSVESYSVKEYCNALIGKTAGELGYTTAKYNAMKTLLADMLDYGAAAQKYRHYHSDNLPNTDAWVASCRSTFTVPADCKNVGAISDVNCCLYSVGVRLSDVVQLYFKFDVTDWTDVTVDVTRKGQKRTYTRSDITDDALYLDAVYAGSFGDAYTLELKHNGTVMQTVIYSVNSYIASKYNGSNGELVQALGRYGASAAAFNAQ